MIGSVTVTLSFLKHTNEEPKKDIRTIFVEMFWQAVDTCNLCQVLFLLQFFPASHSGMAMYRTVLYPTIN